MPHPRCRELLNREMDPVLHSGVLFKRGYGRLLGRKTWKPRHFVLTRIHLRYYTFENGKLRDEVDLRRCTEKSLEIMPADICKHSRAAASIWRVALNVPQGRRLVMAAPTEFEMNAWIQQIRTVLRELASKKKPLTEPVEPKRKPETLPHQRRGDRDETKEEEELFEPPFSNQSNVPMLDNDALDRPATATWKTTTTDFQNFVAQPRRSMIFRRQSFEGQPLVPGVYRNSTGQLDDRELQKELEELRAEIGLVPGAAAAAASTQPEKEEEEMDDEEEEEEVLLRALRQFSKTQRESSRLEIEIESKSDTQPVEGSLSSFGSRVDDNQNEKTEADSELLIGPTKPIFYYKKEETNAEPAVTATSRGRTDTTGGNDAKWFPRVSSKRHRRSKRGENAAPREDSTVSISRESTSRPPEDDDSDLPAHFHQEDPATSKPRRYSTGSMLLTSERSALAQERDSETEREDALIQELLTGLAYCHTDEGATSQRDIASPRDDSNAWVSGHAKNNTLYGTPTPTSSVDIDEFRLSRSYDIDEMRRASGIDIDEIRCSEAKTTTASSVLSSTRASFDDSAARAMPLARVSRKKQSIDVVEAQPETTDDEVDEFSNETWFRSFKTRWRASRDEKKERKRAAKRAKSLPSPAASAPVVDSASESSLAAATEMTAAKSAQQAADCDVDSVISDVIVNVAALDYSTWTPRATDVDVTSPCSMTARGMQPRQLSRTPEALVAHAQSTRDIQTKKRGIFGHWREKLHDKQQTRSRRHSTGDLILETAVPPVESISSATDEAQPSGVNVVDERSESHHFSAKYRRDLTRPRGLIELQSTDAIGTTSSHASRQFVEEEDSEDEVVVVVVRGRHSIGCAEDEGPASSRRGQKRVKYRVFVDVGEDEGVESSEGPNSSKREAPSTRYHMISAPMQPSHICAA